MEMVTLIIMQNTIETNTHTEVWHIEWLIMKMANKQIQKIEDIADIVVATSKCVLCPVKFYKRC